MKKRQPLFTTILTMFLLFAGTGTAWASSYEGRLDSATGGAIAGWAWDSADPSSYAVVRIIVTNKDTAEVALDTLVTASQHREDLASTGKGNGNHAFSTTIDWAKLDPGTYTVEARIGDFSLNTLTCQDGQVISSAPAGNLIPLGTFKTTAYCPCYACSEGWGRHTSTGALAVSNHTIAVDPRVIPYGSKVMINGITYTAEDRGGGVKGNHIDIFFNTHGETRQYGTRGVEVFLVQ